MYIYKLVETWPSLFIRPDILHFEKKIEGQFFFVRCF